MRNPATGHLELFVLTISYYIIYSIFNKFANSSEENYIKQKAMTFRLDMGN